MNVAEPRLDCYFPTIALLWGVLILPDPGDSKVYGWDGGLSIQVASGEASAAWCNVPQGKNAYVTGREKGLPKPNRPTFQLC